MPFGNVTFAVNDRFLKKWGVKGNADHAPFENEGGEVLKGTSGSIQFLFRCDFANGEDRRNRFHSFFLRHFSVSGRAWNLNGDLFNKFAPANLRPNSECSVYIPHGGWFHLLWESLSHSIGGERKRWQAVMSLVEMDDS
jgi:hypothetical protein